MCNLFVANKVSDFINKYLFPTKYWPFIVAALLIFIVLIIIFFKKIKKNFELFKVFFKLGLFTFGGGYAMIPHIKEIVVEQKKWINEEEILEIIAIAESTPGPIAINMATYIGYKQGKITGSILATTGVVLPSLIIIYAISLIFNQFISNEYVAAAFIGIKACVAFLITKAGIEMLMKIKKNLFNILLFALIFILIIVLEIFGKSFSSIILILIGGLLNIIINLISSLKTKEMRQ